MNCFALMLGALWFAVRIECVELANMPKLPFFVRGKNGLVIALRHLAAISGKRISDKNLGDHATMHIRQLIFPPGIKIGQLLRGQPYQVQERTEQIMHLHSVLLG